jgi:outer membrane receptor protein involved in Fe transport
MPVAALANVSGTVIDSISKNPMQYTNVVLKSISDSSIVSGTITEETGFFKLERVPYGQYFIEINFIGYERKLISNIVLNKQNKDLKLGTVILHPAVQNLKEVDIVADRNYVTYEVDKKVVNVSKNLTAQGGTAGEALQDVPSVRVSADGTVSLRGSSSFMVLVDGRPSPVDAQTLLKTLPANAIENIEIITNPSAKYDPDGTTGIVNIIMKKEKITGFNGMINLAGSTMGGYGVTANLNYRTERVNYFINTNYHHSPNIMRTKNDRKTFFGDTITHLKERTNRTQIHKPQRFNAGADFYLNDKNYLMVKGVIGGFSFIRDFDTKYEYFSDVTPHQYSLSNNDFTVKGLYYGGGFSYEHKFAKDHKIELGGGGWIWEGNDRQLSQQFASTIDYEQGMELARVKTHNANLRKNIRLKVDYTAPLFKGKFEAGAQGLFSNGNSNYLYHNYDLNTSIWVLNTNNSNEMDFGRDLISGYATYTNSWKGFNYMLGLRVEYMDRLLDQKTLGKKYPLELMNYYPSAHISKKVGKKSQVQASYSRRINRPQGWELNPFPDYTDQYNFSMGNPLLKPEDIDSWELNFLQQFKKATMSMGGYYRQTNNSKIMAQQILPDQPEVMFMTYLNLDRTYAYGGEMMLKMYLSKWFNYTLTMNAYHYNVSATIAEISSTQSSNNFDANLKLSFNIKKQNKLELTAVYNSPGADGQGLREENYYANLAFRRNLLKNKASLVLSVHDVFVTSRHRTIVQYDEFYSYFELRNMAPVVRLSFSYRINNYKHKVDKSGIGGR